VARARRRCGRRGAQSGGGARGGRSLSAGRNIARPPRRALDVAQGRVTHPSGVESASGRLGVYPPPCGEGRRTQASLRSLRKLGCAAPGWGSWADAPAAPHTTTPTPNPSPQGGGESTEYATRSCVEHKLTRPDITSPSLPPHALVGIFIVNESKGADVPRQVPTFSRLRPRRNPCRY
jgi:hypothetical protein